MFIVFSFIVVFTKQLVNFTYKIIATFYLMVFQCSINLNQIFIIDLFLIIIQRSK